MSLSEQFKQQQDALSNGFKQNSQQSNAAFTGVSVPVSIQRNGAKLRLGIMLSADVLQSPQALEAALSELEQIFDLDVWQPSSSNSGGGFKSGGFNGNSSYGNSGFQRSGSWNNNRRW